MQNRAPVGIKTPLPFQEINTTVRKRKAHLDIALKSICITILIGFLLALT